MHAGEESRKPSVSKATGPKILPQKDMLEDHKRTGAYYQAVMQNRRQFEGRVVLDVGTGSGILAIFAAKAGAKKVYAVEATGMAKFARELVQHNKVHCDVVSEVLHGPDTVCMLTQTKGCQVALDQHILLPIAQGMACIVRLHANLSRGSILIIHNLILHSEVKRICRGTGLGLGPKNMTIGIRGNEKCMHACMRAAGRRSRGDTGHN